MFKTKLLSAAVVAVALVGCGEEQSSETTDVQLETLEQRASYIMGRQYGEQLSGGDQFQIDHAVLMAGHRISHERGTNHGNHYRVPRAYAGTRSRSNGSR